MAGGTIQKAKGSKKNRKVGRAKARCQDYRLRRQRERNKVIRLTKHVQRQPNDDCGQRALDRYELFVRVGPTA
jgi:hypothetical protein